MAVVQISDVKINSAKSHDLAGCYLDLPRPGDESNIYALDIAGWILGKSSPVVGVEFRSAGLKLQWIPLSAERQDVAKHFPHVPGAGNSGFKARVNILPLEEEFAIDVVAHLDNTGEIPIGRISGRRQSVNTGYQPTLNPLMVTTLGRTGSTWLMHLLSGHPQIIAYRPFEYEPRVGSYWMELLKNLSEPCSYMQMLNADVTEKTWWLRGKGEYSGSYNPDPIIHRWLGGSSLEELAAFCLNRVESFYERIASIQRLPDAVYFAEKYSPGYFAPALMWELYPKAKEVILVRDFRDMICSIFAYNNKRGQQMFGRNQVQSDEDYISYLLPSARLMLETWVTRRQKALLIRYEDLIREPENCLQGLINYLNLETTQNVVCRMIAQAQITAAKGQEHHQTSPNAEASIGRWREDLSLRLQDLCNETFADVLREFGYNV